MESDDPTASEALSATAVSRALDLALQEVADLRRRNLAAMLVCIGVTLFSIAGSAVFTYLTLNSQRDSSLAACSFFALCFCAASALTSAFGIMHRQADVWPMSGNVRTQCSAFLEAATASTSLLEKQEEISLALQRAFSRRYKLARLSISMLLGCPMFMVLSVFTA